MADGLWGGPHIAITVTSAAAHIEFDCASGDIPAAIAVDIHGGFTVDGVFVREHPGPIRPGEADPRPARYSGHVDGTTMTINALLLDSNDTLGPFTLALGADPRVVKCL